MALRVSKAHKIKATADCCDELLGPFIPCKLRLSCGSVLLDVVFNKGKSPLPDGETERKACLVCDATRRPPVPLNSEETFNAQTVSKTGKNFFRRNPGKGKAGEAVASC